MPSPFSFRIICGRVWGSPAVLYSTSIPLLLKILPFCSNIDVHAFELKIYFFEKKLKDFHSVGLPHPKLKPVIFLLWNCEEKIYCCSVILLSLIKIIEANAEILYSLVLASLGRKQAVDH